MAHARVNVRAHPLSIDIVPITKLANRAPSLDGNLRLRRPGRRCARHHDPAGGSRTRRAIPSS